MLEIGFFSFKINAHAKNSKYVHMCMHDWWQTTIKSSLHKVWFQIKFVGWFLSWISLLFIPFHFCSSQSSSTFNFFFIRSNQIFCQYECEDKQKSAQAHSTKGKCCIKTEAASEFVTIESQLSWNWCQIHWRDTEFSVYNSFFLPSRLKYTAKRQWRRRKNYAPWNCLS